MLKGILVRIEEIGNRDVLFSLMDRHYERMDRSRFEMDLNQKEGAIILENESGKVHGFSTYQFLHTRFAGRQIIALFSGDTVVDKAFWGDSALFRTFGKLLYQTMRNESNLYWFLISKGIRTYQMLPLFFKRFYPSVDEETPDEAADLIRHLAELKYPGFFDAKSGLVKTRTYRLKKEMADIPLNKRMNHHIRFFLDKNPGWRVGDELACLTELNPNNMKGTALRLIRNWNH